MSERQRGIERALFAWTTLLGATLSFAVQPMVGRFLLPRFGGTPAVWVSCLALFQLALLLGYAIVHVLATRTAMRTQAVLVASVLAACVLREPLTLPDIALNGGDAPGWAIVRFFGGRVALSYVALALTAPLLQRWYTAIDGSEPYRLYAVSNAGSFLGLLGYPLVVEPLVELPDQARHWSLGFAGYAACMALLAIRAATTTSPPPSAARLLVPMRARVYWVALAACPSALLCAVSNHITTDVAAMPLLWVVPLALYLLTFVAAFSTLGLRHPRVYAGAWIMVTVAMPVLLVPKNQAPLPLLLLVPLATLFVGARLCHAELAARRPPADQATGFYMMVALGGALGGGFVGLAAPLLFADHYELPLSMLAIHALLLAKALRSNRSHIVPSGEQRLAWLGFGLAVPLLCAAVVSQATVSTADGRVVDRARNFFGPLRVADMPPFRVLRHGRTNHGMQFIDPSLRREPLAYYSEISGVGHVLRRFAMERPRHIGVLGLGVGTLAAYTKADDSITFYELDPAVTVMAQRHFTFLSDSAARPRIVSGDGRLMLAAERNAPPYDVLVLDAFSSDSVPVHLLTKEAFAVYLSRLAPGGILAANVANRHLRVERVVVGAAQAHGLSTLMLDSPADAARGYARVRFVLMARPGVDLQRFAGPPARTVAVPDPILFRDQRASLLALLH